MTKDRSRDRTEVASLLWCQPRPLGPRIAVVTTDAGARFAAEDALDEAGLLPASVTQHTEMRTRLVAPTVTHTGGSVTLPREADGESLAFVIDTLAEDPGVDAVLVAVDPDVWPGAQLARTLDAVSARFPRTTVVVAGRLVRPDGGRVYGRVPAYPDLRRAAQALASVLDPASAARAPRLPVGAG